MKGKLVVTAALLAGFAALPAVAQDTHSINPNGTASTPLSGTADQSGTPNHRTPDLNGAAGAAGAGASTSGSMTDNGLGTTAGAGAGANLSALDTDSDGMISRTEAKTNKDLAKQFSKLDTNKDGKLSASEYASFEANPSGASGSSSTRTTR